MAANKSEQNQCENDLVDNKSDKKFLWRQALSTFGSACSTLSAGFTVGYSAILLPQLKYENIMTIDEDLSSWIASIAPLSMCFGCMMAGYLTDGLGRRNSHIFLTVPFLIGWLLIAFGTNTNFLLAGRFISGLCAGAIRPLSVVFIGEMAAPKYRGLFLFISSLSMNMGVLGSHLLGTYLDWRVTAALCAIPPVLGCIVMFQLPESPTWLISKRTPEHGEAAFVWYRGKDEAALKELESIVTKQTAKSSNLTFKKKIEIIITRDFLSPFFTTCVMFAAVQFCGVNVIPFYATDILEETIGNVDPYFSMLLLDSIRVLASAILVLLANYIPRKLTFVVCCFGASIMMFALAGFLYAKPIGWSWVPLLLMIVYTFFTSSGIVTLSWTFLAEIFPARIRGFGSGVGSSMSYAFLFISVKISPSIMSNYGEYALFLIFACITFVCGGALQFLLSETQGKTLQEIEDGYDDKKSKSVS